MYGIKTQKGTAFFFESQNSISELTYHFAIRFVSGMLKRHASPIHFVLIITMPTKKDPNTMSSMQAGLIKGFEVQGTANNFNVR